MPLSARYGCTSIGSSGSRTSQTCVDVLHEDARVDVDDLELGAGIVGVDRLRLVGRLDRRHLRRRNQPDVVALDQAVVGREVDGDVAVAACRACGCGCGGSRSRVPSTTRMAFWQARMRLSRDLDVGEQARLAAFGEDGRCRQASPCPCARARRRCESRTWKIGSVGCLLARHHPRLGAAAVDAHVLRVPGSPCWSDAGPAAGRSRRRTAAVPSPPPRSNRSRRGCARRRRRSRCSSTLCLGNGWNTCRQSSMSPSAAAAVRRSS